MEQLQLKTQKPGNDTLYVVNFWATWCRPCVEEMPYFENAGLTFSGRKVKIILVSLDFLSDKEKVNNFIGKRKLHNTVYLLDAGNPNIWINKVDDSWGGSIPATVFYKEGKKILFHEGEFNQRQLDSIIKIKSN